MQTARRAADFFDVSTEQVPTAKRIASPTQSPAGYELQPLAGHRVNAAPEGLLLMDTPKGGEGAASSAPSALLPPIVVHAKQPVAPPKLGPMMTQYQRLAQLKADTERDGTVPGLSSVALGGASAVATNVVVAASQPHQASPPGRWLPLVSRRVLGW